jgi:hypothetical protein
MKPSSENLKARAQFLTGDLVTRLSTSPESAKDYFTATENYPKAFRVGECVQNSDNNVELQVVLLWRDDTKNDQKQVHVETLMVDGKWLINKVSDK